MIFMFCVECGSTDKKMVGDICIDCFLKDFQMIEIPENIKVETGIFGADMKVSLINDGPITIMLEK